MLFLLGLLLLVHLSTMGSGNRWVVFRVPRGAGAASVARALGQEGLVRSPFLFKVWARFQGLDKHLLAGSYRLNTSWSLEQILATLASGRVATVRLVVPEGATVEEIARRVQALHLGSERAFLAASRQYGVFPPSGPGVRFRAEGYLYPATYLIPLGESPAGIVRRLEANFRRHFGPVEIAAAARLGLSPNEAVTLASLVQAETPLPSEERRVAAVFLNRLHIGMRLQSDPSVRYALGRDPVRLSARDLKVPSTYNTYLIYGLPPGPIDSPGPAALAAALHPAKVPYLFFVGRPDGSEAYATDYPGQVRNVRRILGPMG